MSKENSKILISGASGNVGQHVVTQLAQKKVSARAGVHSEEKASALRETGVDAVILDFDSPRDHYRGIQRYRHTVPRNAWFARSGALR